MCSLDTYNKRHRNVYGDNPPVVGWRKPKLLKYYAVSAKIKCESSSDNKSAPSGSRYQICPFIEETNTFQNKNKSEMFDIDAKFVLLLRNLALFKTWIKVKCWTLENEF